MELPTVTKAMIPTKGKGKKVTFANYTKVAKKIFDKSFT